MDVRGKRVLITGASRGIGESMAHAFADAGATVGTGRAEQRRDRAHSPRISAVALTTPTCPTPTRCRVCIERIEADGGPIDVLVNNAGVESSASLWDAPDAELQRRHAGGLPDARRAVPASHSAHAPARRGHIVNVSSAAAVAAFPGMVTYAASKAALSHFTAG